MFDNQDGHPQTAHLCHNIHSKSDLIRVHSTQRLVQHQQPGLDGQRSGNAQHLLIAVRQILGALVFHFTQPNQVKDFEGLFQRVGFVVPVFGSIE